MAGCFTSVLPITDVSPQPISLGATALALIHAAGKQRPVDRRLAHEAREIFGSALAHLRHVLAVASQQKQTHIYSAHTILLSILLIALFEEPANMRQEYCSMQSSWVQHLYAAPRYMKAIGPGAFDLSKQSEAAVIQSAMLMSFKTSLSLRRKMVLEHDTLRFLCATVAGTIQVPVDLFQWHRIVFPLPGLLEQTDYLMHAFHEHSDAKCASLVQSLVQLRRELHLFFRTFLHPLTALVIPSDLDSNVEEHRFISSSPVFRFQYHFPSLTVGVTCIMTWLSCLIADCAALRITHRRAESRNGPENAASDLEHTAFDSATQLCQSVHFLSERDNLTYAHTLNMVLGVAGTFFTELGTFEESAWCQACRTACQGRLDRLSISQPRSLCRVSNVTPALVAAVQHRSLKTFCWEELIT